MLKYSTEYLVENNFNEINENRTHIEESGNCADWDVPQAIKHEHKRKRTHTDPRDNFEKI